jgi:2-phosphosulfolactate phosphatase
VEIRREEGVEGARRARGTAVVIDVIRAFTTAACAFAAGARDLVLTDSVESAFEQKRRHPDAFLMGEVGGAKVEGFDHGNSPSDFPNDAVRGRRVIQCTGSGTRCAVAASGAESLYVASLNVAGATARAVASSPVVTIVASAGGLEGDDAVGDFIQGLLQGSPPPVAEIVRRVRESEAGRRIESDAWPQYPKRDLDVCTRVDAHPFAMRAERENGLFVVRAIRA